ncbi:MAG: pilus assembly FimT family protein [Gemmataceae bacterium]
MTRISPRRGGFTLIELLIVVGILAALSVIAAGVFFRMQSNQEVKATEAIVQKLSTGLNRQWSAVRDQAEKEWRQSQYPVQRDSLMLLAGGDEDRAKAVWLYMRLKQEFPNTFAEAKAAVTVTGKDANGSTVSATLATKKLWNQLPSSTTLTAQQQSAVLLHWILSEKGAGGALAGDEALNNSAGVLDPNDSNQFRVFRDPQNQPMLFIRWATNTELNTPPYIKSGATSNDPVDPLGKLVSWSNTTKTPNANIRGNAATVATGLGITGGFQGNNWACIIVAQGGDKTSSTTPTTGITTVSFDQDDIVSYRLRREGQRGD